MHSHGFSVIEENACLMLCSAMEGKGPKVMENFFYYSGQKLF